MHLKHIIIAASLATVPAASAWAQSDEEQFQSMVTALQVNDGEREAAIATCIAQGIGDNPTGAAAFMGVPVEEAAEAWCTRMTNGIAQGKLTLVDVQALNDGTVTPGAAKVLTAAREGE